MRTLLIAANCLVAASFIAGILRAATYAPEVPLWYLLAVGASLATMICNVVVLSKGSAK